MDLPHPADDWRQQGFCALTDPARQQSAPTRRYPIRRAGTCHDAHRKGVGSRAS
jgi:hypothetical protein